MAKLNLEVFETDDSAESETIVTDLSAMEEARLSAYEQGYTAGWDDAAAAQSDEHGRISTELARNFQALGFTFQEARTHVLLAMEPLLRDLVSLVLPRIARDTLPVTVAEVLMPLVNKMAEEPVTLVFNPAMRAAVEKLLDHVAGPPLKFLEEPSLGEGQVYLRLGDSETRIDLDAMTDQIASAIDDFFTLSKQEAKHG